MSLRSLLATATLAAAIACSLDVQDFSGKSCEVSADCPEPYSCVPSGPDGARTCERLQLPQLFDGGERLDGPIPDWCNDVKPLMGRYCAQCHAADAGTVATGGSGRSDFRLDYYADAGASGNLPGAFDFRDRIKLRMVDQAGRPSAMPPPSYPSQPNPTELERVKRWALGGGPRVAPQAQGCIDDGTFTVTDGGGGGDGGVRGLLGTYYNNADFTGLIGTRVDPNVDFIWTNTEPFTGVGMGTYSVKWEGQIVPAYSESYTFFTRSDDGVRLRVNGTLLIDDFVIQAALKENPANAAVALTAGQPVSVELEFFRDLGAASEVHLLWESASQPKGVIPQAQLRAP